MKANINISQGESTQDHVTRKVAKYLAKQDRVVSIKEVHEFLSLTDATVSRMTEQGFEKLARSQVMAHAMRHM